MSTLSLEHEAVTGFMGNSAVFEISLKSRSSSVGVPVDAPAVTFTTVSHDVVGGSADLGRFRVYVVINLKMCLLNSVVYYNTLCVCVCVCVCVSVCVCV